MKKAQEILQIIFKLISSWYVLFFYAFVLFFLKSYFTLDTDFGWHITLGKYIFTHGIAYTDPFSYSMPSYPFVDHEWLTNIGMYALFTFVGKLGMTILWSMFALCALILSSMLIEKTYKNFGKLFFLLASVSFVIYAGVRTQVLSWLFFSLLLFLLSRKQVFLQVVGSVVVMLFWTNMHGSFPVGLVLIATAAFIQKQKKLWLLFLISLAVTFINPYGKELWREVANQMSDSTLRFSISEWFPAVFFPTFISLWLYIGVLGTLLLTIWKKVNKLYLSLFALFVLMGASSLRHMPFALLLGIPLGAQAVYELLNKVTKIPHGGTRFLYAYKVLALACILVVCVELVIAHDFTFFSESSYFPKEEVAYLQKHLPVGNLFSVYDWGGYLIWKLPEKKVFIDGRMPSWRWQAPHKESNNAFLELRNVVNEKESFSYFEKKYHITTLLLPKKIEKSKEQDAFLEEIKKAGYKTVFTGKVGVICEKEPAI